jgi:hypothetical protein
MDPFKPKGNNYDLFLEFISHSLAGGFKDIDRMDPLIMQLEESTKMNNQFFLVHDLIQLKILFTSLRSREMLGIEPVDVNPSVFYRSMHPDDLLWHNMAQTRLFSVGQKLFLENRGSAIISTNFRLKNSSGEYINTLVQCNAVFTDVPYKTVFVLMVFTDISWFKQVNPGYHMYIGKDPSYFRYPDEKLLVAGNVFSTL